MRSLATITLLVTDVDGVWTDCTVLADAAGNEWLRYSKRDGVLLPAMKAAGIEVVALTSEGLSGPHRARATKLGIALHTCSPDGKLAALETIARVAGVALPHVAYIGDDLPDLPCLEAVGAAGGAAFVPWASPAGRLDPTRADGTERFLRTGEGGDDALRNVCEQLLSARGYDLTRWPVTR